MSAAILPPPVRVPLGAIFAFQSVITMGAYSLPVVIPVAAPDLGLPVNAVGFLVAILYGVAMVAGLASGALVARIGATRVFQLLLGLTALAAATLWLGNPAAAVLTAVALGVASGPMNPTGSHVLGRITPGHARSLVFSLKQCGTPAGGMLAGSLLPPLMLAYDWRIAMGLLVALAVGLAVFAPLARLEPERAEPPAGSGGLAAVWRSLAVVVKTPSLRAVTLGGLGLGIAQMGVATYLVVFLLEDVGYAPDLAGLVFAFLHVTGIASRVVLGAMADRLIAARQVLVAVAVVLTGALLLISRVDAGWPLAGVFALIALAGASGNGWVGLYFAELARLSPPGRTAEVAGGSQFFTYVGLVIGPTLFGTVLEITGNFAHCFILFALIAAASGACLAASGEGSRTQRVT